MKKSFYRGSLVIAAGALMAAAMLSGQEPSGNMPSGAPQGQQQQMPNSTMPSDNGMPSSMANYKANEFLKNTFENNQAQEQMSQMASQKAQADDVKQFGSQMVQIHNKLDEQLAPMAKQMGVSQSKGPSKKDKKELDKLQALSGADFDTEYLQAMGDQQQRSLKQFDDETKDSANQAAQEAAKSDQPVLRQNYEVLQKIAQAHNVTLQQPMEKK